MEIARVLLARSQHLSAEQLLHLVRDEGRIAVSKATVYNTLNLYEKVIPKEYVSVEHLWLALIDEGERNTAGRVVAELGINRDRFLGALTEVRGNQRVTSATPETAYEALDKYGVDLVEQARRGRLDPVIGRDSEIRRAIRILSRKTKNNPVLIGEPGVGKTAIVEGFASRIVEREQSPSCPIHGERGSCLTLGW